ncbi:MAG: hypothetical protein F2693_16860, partial [Actinobacteria bacterium]|nr:hypothetical protein [Actinomycetota bacterium]
MEPGRAGAAHHLRHRPLPGLPGPGRGRGGRGPHRPRLRRRPGAPGRPGPLGGDPVTVTVAGLVLASPVLVASGCAGTGRELAGYAPLSTYGAVVTRSITRDPRPGAQVPSIAETPAGLVHATGLPNPGLDGFLATELPWLLTEGARVVVSVVARELGEYAEVARRLATAPGVSAVEVNLAQPDAVAAGVLDVREPFHVGAAVSAVLRELPRGVPVLAKLRPDTVRVAEAVKVAADAGAAAVVLGGAL